MPSPSFNRMRMALLADSGGATTIGGLPIGAVGTGIYAGMKFVDGDDFLSLDLLSPTNPNGAYLTTRASYSGSGNMRAPASGALAPNVYVDPGYTGIADANRGVPMTWDGLGGVAPHSIISGEGTGAIRLMSGRQSTAEKALLNAGVNPERTAMIASLGRITFQAPCIIEARVRYTSGGPAGWHPSFWAYTTQPNQGGDGNEYGFEGNSTTLNAYMDDHTTGTVQPNSGTLQVVANAQDGNWHTRTIIQTTSYWSFLIDGVEVNRIGPGINFGGSNASNATWSPAHHALADFFMLTNPAYNATFLSETYSGASWIAATAGAACDCEWWRVWIPTTGTMFKPIAASSLVDQQFTAGQAFSVTLPSQATIWGASVTENVIGLQVEVEEPGSNNTTGFSTTTGLPAWASYNSGTRVLSGTIPANAGRTHFKIDAVGSGNACKPYRFRFDVAPVFSGSTSVSFTNGTPGSYDLYAAWDCGRLIGAAGGTAGKTLTATGLPAGMTLASNGVISGTPTTTTAYTVTTTCTNSVGQLTSQSITMTVNAASSPVAAPALSIGTIVGSWDPNDPGTITSSAGVVTNIAGSSLDGVATALANASTGPTIVARSDGNAHAKTALLFHTNQYLQIASGLGLTGAFTVIAVVEFVTNNITQAIADVGNSANNFNSNRFWLGGSSSSASGISLRKMDNAAVSSVAATGAFPTAGAGNLHLYVGRAVAGAGQVANINMGSGAEIVGTPTSGQPSGLSHTTWGASREAAAQAKFGEFYGYRLIFVNAYITDADVANVYTWAQTNYGVLTN